jgi:hypothetical protein
MTERSRGPYNVDADAQSTAENVGHLLAGKSGALFVALIMLTMGLTVVPGAAAQDFGEYGSFVDAVDDNDLAPLLKTDSHTDVSGQVAFCIGYVDDPDETGPSRRAWFFHIATDASCSGESVENARSYRITEFGGNENSKWITDSDTQYTGKTFAQIASASSAGWLCYLESDGADGYSLGDPVYVDNENFPGGSGTAGTISVHDLRLTDTSSGDLAPFSVQRGIVESGDSDLSDAGDTSNDPTERPTGDSLTCGSNFEAAVFDLGTQDTYDSDDVFYLDHSDLPSDPGIGSNEARPVPGTVRLTGGSTLTGGEKVTDGDSDHRPFLQQLSSPGEIKLATTSASSTPDKRIYLHVDHPDTSDGFILQHDAVLKGSSGTSASNAGQIVTSTSHAGTAIDSIASLDDRVFYIDEDGDSSYDVDENVYIKHPDNSNPPVSSLEVNDIRLDVDGETAGSLVESGDDDYSTWKSTSVGTGFSIKVQNQNVDERPPLRSVQTANFLDEDDDSTWDPSNEDVYLGSVTNDSDGTTYTRVWGSGSADDTDITCPNQGSPPCGSQKLTSTSNVRTTGPDNSYDASNDEFLYWSADDRLTVGDYGLAGQGPSGQVSAGNSHLTAAQLQQNDVTLYASHDSCSPCFPFLSPGDIELVTSFGDRLDSSSSDIVPEVSAQSNSEQRLIRHDYGSSGLTEDTYYLDLSTNQDFRAASVLRLTPFSQESRSAGAFLQDTFQTETSTNHQVSSTEYHASIGYIESGTQSGFGTDDYVYLDLPQDLGATASNEGSMSQWDARMNSFTFSGTSFDAGSRVKTSHDDHASFSGDSLTDQGTSQWQLLHWDADLDGAVDNDDFLWLHKGTDSPSAPSYLDIRLSGSGGATESGGSSSGGSSGGGGGGGGTTQTPPSISISSPSSGDQLDPDVEVSISGSASGGSDSINSVSVTAGGESLTVTGTSSWSTSWTTPEDDNGTHTITATVTDSDGETRTDTLDVAVGSTMEDADNDDVADDEDNCPDTANPDQEDLDNDGTGDACDQDTDGDGLYDEQDQCPEETGPIDNNGCPRDDGGEETPDTDDDGVSDPADECPQDSGTRANDGCPEEDTNDTNETPEEPEDTPAAGLLAVLLATTVAVLIRRD